MNHRLLGAFVVAAPALIWMGASANAADAEAGKTFFKRCQVCHKVEAGAPSALGPNLHGLFGRKAGTVEGFNYSEGMKESGIVWNDETLRKYLSDPRNVVPGNKMAFPGIKNDADLDNLLAYLKDATK